VTGDALLPEIDDVSRPFWEGAAAGELRMQRCARCHSLRFPPRPVCPRCQSFDVEWLTMSGRGRIWSFVVPHPPLLPAFMAVAPYNVVVVELEEDPVLRMVGNLVAGPDAPINSVDPSTIRIGEPVRAVFERVAEDVALPRWMRAEP
jgi:uncharacterized OB-fold protein